MGERMSPGEVTPSTSEGNQSVRTEGGVDDEKHHGKNERMHTTQGLQALALRGPPSCCAKLVNAIPEFNESSGMVETTKQSVRSEASMDPEQKKAEEERLHAIVKSFSKDAISGLNCKMIEH